MEIQKKKKKENKLSFLTSPSSTVKEISACTSDLNMASCLTILPWFY